MISALAPMQSNDDHAPLRCPVCRASFRGRDVCARCGADLTRIMSVVLEGWSLRSRARRAILDGDYAAAVAIAQRAVDAQATPAARDLLLLSRIAARAV